MTDGPESQTGPLPLPRAFADPPISGDARTILVFGGSFDPPHVGHRTLALSAREAIGADWLLLVPAAQSPHKDTPPLLTGDQRLELLRIAFEGDDRTSLCRMELDRRERRPKEPSYTIDTLHTLRGFLPLDVRLRLIIGADQALSLHRWHEPRAVLALAEPVIMRREDADDAVALARQIGANWEGMDAENVDAASWQSRIVDVPLIEASSTEVRDLLAQPPSEPRDARLHELLGGQVFQRLMEIRAGA
ncbi:MAG: nicotinate (nicotinamide) nucleotide adenylyltransferase [Phycisphaerales bacterium JB050]